MILTYVAFIIALLLVLMLGIPYLDFLKKNLYSQYIREEGPESHKQKSGTPTMGGVVIVASALIASIVSLIMNQSANLISLIALFSFIAFTFVGATDDLAKIMKKENKGLSARKKLLLQVIIAVIPALYLTAVGKTTVSFFSMFDVNLSYFYPFFAIFVIISASNAVNLTDGIDGLACSTSGVAFLALAFICSLIGRYELSIISMALAGSCFGFLYFNKYPAKVFMGDTGSLALGGILGTIAVLAKIEIWLLLIGFVFIVETLSVIIQVISFKTTGKRVFKMSPIHHHFELLGWSELKIVKIFTGVGLFFALVSMFLADKLLF